MLTIDKYTLPRPSGALPVWDPGTVTTDELRWDQKICSDADVGCIQARPGIYAISASFGSYRAPPVSVTIR